MAFHIHRSNRTERLCDELARLLEQPKGTPFAPDRVIVQGRGMGIWLGGQLARRFGVWAAPMTYPRAFMQELTTTVLGEGAVGERPVSEGLLSWAVLASLDDTAGPEFSALQRYCEGDTHGSRSAALARRIATVFDQYLTYRPDWVKDWESGQVQALPPEERWQGLLWRQVARRLAPKDDRPWHLGVALTRLVERLRAKGQVAGLPPRVLLFGLSTLPPLYVKVLAALSRHIDVHWFAFSAAPGARTSAVRGLDDNPLLASLATLGTDFERVLHDALKEAGITPDEHELHVEPRGQSVLARLQRDLFAATPRSAPAQPTIAPCDVSEAHLGPEIAVHACHGPMREVEVLHDQLLALLTRQTRPVSPEEVIVLVPDLQVYAPLIEAVFARDLGDPDFIPHHIADLSARQGAPLIDGFLRVLGMVRGRVRVSEVMDLLMVEPLQRRLALTPSDLDHVRTWLQEGGVRWGRDAEHKQQLGLPAQAANTWSFGLHRLLLGYALPTAGEQLFAEVLPYDEVEGKEAELLGTLAAFTRTLFTWLERLEQPVTLAQWSALVPQLLSDLFVLDGEDAGQFTHIVRLLEGATQEAAAAGFERPVDVQVIRDLCVQGLDQAGTERGFFSGGVTFCAMVPMRSIPFRIVCLLGMNDGSFPRSPRPLEMDLIQNKKLPHRAGDRSRRDDDRHLFLETLDAARERLIVTYTGQSVNDDRIRPPSVCVAELLDYLAMRFPPAQGNAYFLRHRLQGFSPDYFSADTSPRFFSHAPLYARAAKQTQQTRQKRRFLEQLLPPLDTSELALAHLVRFLSSPPAYFLKHRLGLYLQNDEVTVTDREPLELNNLDRWRLGDPMVKHLVRKRPLAEVHRLLRAQGILPAGQTGTLLVEELQAVCEEIAKELISATGGDAREVLPLRQAAVGGLRLTGVIDSRYPLGRVVSTYSLITAKHEIDAWVHHLAMCGEGQTLPSVLIGRAKSGVALRKWLPVSAARARELLADLVRLYCQGQRSPLPFLPVPSCAYFTALGEQKDGHRAAVDAYDPEGKDFSDPYPARAFDGLLPPFEPAFDAGQVPLEDTEFHRLALRVFEPLVAGLTEGAT